jgi:hypothetical protein
MNTLIDQLAAANPVPEPPHGDADALLAAILAQPRRTRARRRPARAVAVLATLAAATAAVLVATSASGNSLADRAYAAALPGKALVHEVVLTSWHGLNDDKTLGTERLEAWYHPADGRARRLYDTEGDRIEIVVDANGRLILRGGDAGPNWTSNDDPAFVRKNSTDFLHEFRVAYVNKQLEDAGPASFDGRPAHAFRVKQPDGITEETWYVDAKTAQPLGDVRRFAGAGGQVVTRRLATYEKLPATAANLAVLTP